MEKFRDLRNACSNCAMGGAKKMFYSGLKYGCWAFVGLLGCASQAVVSEHDAASLPREIAVVSNGAADPSPVSPDESSAISDTPAVSDNVDLMENNDAPDELNLDVLPVANAFPELDRQCFSTLAQVTDDRVIGSSVEAVTLENGQMLIAANDANGSAWLWHSLDNGTFAGEMLAGSAQVSCFERVGKEALLGITRRDASSGDYVLEIRRLGNNGKRSGGIWKATAHGFSPDTGAKCALLGNRHFVMSGMRHRMDKLPLHGLFDYKGKVVQLFEGTSAHVPAVVKHYALENGRHELLVRQVESVDEKRSWPHLVYALDEKEIAFQVSEKSDFLYRHGEEWIGISQDGCVSRGTAKICLPSPIHITAVDEALNSDRDKLAMIWHTKEKSYLVLLNGDKLQVMAMPDMLKVFPVERKLSWLASEGDADRPDVMHGLAFMQFDWSCFKVTDD